MYKSLNLGKIETTQDTITGRGGLALFSRYLTKIGVLRILSDSFPHIRKNKKGQPVWQLFKQVLCFFFDGTSRHLTQFDHTKKDSGYAAAIEETPDKLISSHVIKRFFKCFPWVAGKVFRMLLHRLFLWRLQIEQPTEIVPTLDTMVLNNDEASKRHGSQPTYKKVKGFQPLQMIWNNRIIDAIFRGGKKHSNYSTAVVDMITKIVTLIRFSYRNDVTIIIRMDSGFYSEANMKAIDALNVGFIMTGKMYKGVKTHAAGVDPSLWAVHNNGHQMWRYVEFGYRGDSWTRYWRSFYTSPMYEDRQLLLDFARPDNVLHTNIGMNPRVLEHCDDRRRKHWERPKALIACHHQRGADELPHRSLKDFGFEQLPFKRFAANNAFYYCMVIAHFLFESYKQDVLSDIIPVRSYATTVRRLVVDFAAKIVKTAGGIILKVSQATMKQFRLDVVWQRCLTAPPIG